MKFKNIVTICDEHLFREMIFLKKFDAEGICFRNKSAELSCNVNGVDYSHLLSVTLFNDNGLVSVLINYFDDFTNFKIGFEDITSFSIS